MMTPTIALDLSYTVLLAICVLVWTTNFLLKASRWVCIKAGWSLPNLCNTSYETGKADGRRESCETCFQSGKMIAARESAERIEKLEVELKARAESNADLMAEAAEWKSKWAHRDNDAIEAGANLVRLGRQVAETQAKNKQLVDEVEKLDGLLSQAEGEVKDRDRQIASLEAELKARAETGAELSAELARTLAEREKYRAQADQLGGMNERIERRLTAKIQLEKAHAEKRVHDGYSKGYALGQADAYERVRQVFPVNAS